MPVEFVSDPVGGGVYATLTDCREYIAASVLGATTDEQLQPVLDVAEHDIDNILVTPVTDNRPVTGLKYDVAALTAWQAAALTRAVCAQVEYRLVMGEEFFIRAQHETVRGPDFTTQGRLPYIAPKADRELEGTTLAARSDVGSATFSSPTVAAYNRLYPPTSPT